MEGSLGFAALTAHLNPATELAERVLLPSNPHRALAIAQHLLEGPRMFNHAHGLWGYTGRAADGAPLTVQSTGVGGPSAAIVTEELIGLGARRLVRVGSGRALAELEPDALVAAERVVSGDGASAALGANGALGSDPVLLERLVAAGATPGTVVTTDLFYGEPPAGGSVADLETGAVLQVASRHGVPAACVLALAADEELALRAGEAGYAAVTP
jgi:purine-nucleoside phosphorylase